MNINQIRTFLKAIDTGNFHGAAQKLNVTQSTVSGRIRSLEDKLNCKLFVRTHTGVVPTLEGQRFRRHALDLVRLWLRAEQELAATPTNSVILAVGVAPSLCNHYLLKWMSGLRQSEPRVSLRIETDFSVSLMHQLSSGVLDIGVMFEPEYLPGLVVEELFYEKMVLVSTERQADAWRKDYLFVDWGRMFRAVHDGFLPDMAAAISSSHGPLALDYLLVNGGSAYFPLRMVRHLIDTELFRVTDAPVIRRVGFLVHTTSHLDEGVMRSALNSLREVVTTIRET